MLRYIMTGADQQYSFKPVSYTHLDVYKRQDRTVSKCWLYSSKWKKSCGKHTKHRGPVLQRYSKSYFSGGIDSGFFLFLFVFEIESSLFIKLLFRLLSTEFFFSFSCCALRRRKVWNKPKLINHRYREKKYKKLNQDYNKNNYRYINEGVHTHSY